MSLSKDELSFLDGLDKPSFRNEERSKIIDNALNFKMETANTGSPVERLKVRKLADRFGVTPEIVDEDVTRFESVDAAQSLDLAETPRTAEFLTKGDNVEIALQDVEQLKTFEKADKPLPSKALSDIDERAWWEFNPFSDLGRFSDRWIESWAQSARGGELMLNESLAATIKMVTGDETDAEIDKHVKVYVDKLIGEINAGAKRIADLTPEDLTIIGKGVNAGGQSLADILVTAPVGSLLALIAKEVTTQYGMARADGRSPLESWLYASSHGVKSYFTEKLGLKYLGDAASGVTGSASKFFAANVVSEQADTLIGTGIDLGFDMDKELANAHTLGEALAIQMERQAVSLVASGTVSAGVGAVGTVARARAEKQAEMAETHALTRDDNAMIDSLIKASKDSVLLQEAPEIVQGFLNDTKRTVFISPEGVEALQERGLFQDADPTDNLEVGMVDFTTLIARNNDVLGVVRDHLKLRETALTTADIQARTESDTINNLMEREVEESVRVDELKIIKDSMAEQLFKASDFSLRDSGDIASVVAAYVDTVASDDRNDLNVPQVFDKLNLSIENQPEDAGFRLTSADGTVNTGASRELLESENRKDVVERHIEEGGLLKRAHGVINLKGGRGTGEARVIKLFSRDRKTTALHELSHAFLDMEHQLANEGYARDHDSLVKWLGVDSLNDMTSEHHEKFAETFEVYFSKGEAPSRELQPVFNRFIEWFKKVYQMAGGEIMRKRADLTPEISAFMDRLLATDDAIHKVKADGAHHELFRSADQAGMTEERFKEYREQVKKRDDKAKETIEKKFIGRYTRLKTKKWNAERDAIEAQKLVELADKPVHIAQDMLKVDKLDLDKVKQILGVDTVKGRLKTKVAKGAVDPAEMSEHLGYSSPLEMLTDIQESKTLPMAAKDAAQQAMIDRNGDVFNDGTIEGEALDALSNEESVKVIEAEIKALQPKREKIDREPFKISAERIIGKMTTAEIKPAKYQREMKRNARKALQAKKKGDLATAAKHKEAQMANHYLYREAIGARKRVVKYKKHTKAVAKRKYNTNQVDPSYAKNMRFYARQFVDTNVGKMTYDEQQSVVEGLLTWYQSQIDDSSVAIKPMLFDAWVTDALRERDAAKEDHREPVYKLKTFDELTIDEAYEVYQTLVGLRHAGGRLSKQAFEERAVRNKLLIEATNKNASKHSFNPSTVKSKSDKRKILTSGYLSRMPSLYNMARKMDGFTKGGVWMSEVFDKIQDALDAREKLTTEIYKEFSAAIPNPAALGITRGNKVPFTSEKGETVRLTTEARFMLALYWGSKSSRVRISEGGGVDGVQFSERDMTRLMSDLTVDQLKAVNAVWSLYAKLWPSMQRSHTLLNGFAPKPEPHAPYEINGVKMTGGHMPLRYIGRALHVPDGVEQQLNIESLAPKLDGSLNTRASRVMLPLDLNIEHITHTLEESTHYVTFAESARDAQGIMSNPEVQEAIAESQGLTFLQAMHTSLRHITSGVSDRGYENEIFNTASRYMRGVAVANALAYSLKAPVQGLTALFYVQKEVGAAKWSVGASKFLTDWSGTTEFVNSRSQLMAGYHTKNSNLVIRDQAKKMMFESKPEAMFSNVKRFAFIFDSTVNSVIAYPLWMAKYEEVYAETFDEKAAIRSADNTVHTTVGGSFDTHLGASFQSANGEPTKALTYFMGWMNMVYNRMYASTKGGNEVMTFNSLMEIITLPIAGALASQLLVMDVPDFEDDEKFWGWVAKASLSTYTGMFMGIRDIASAVNGFTGSTPMTRGTDGIGRMAGVMANLATDDKEFDGLKTLKVVRSVLPLYGSAIVTRVWSGFNSLEAGNESGSAVKLGYQFVQEGADRNN